MPDERLPPEDDKQGRRPWPRSRTWLVAAVLAGLAASVGTGVTALISRTGSAVSRQVNPQPALKVDAAADLASFQRISLRPPEFVLPMSVDDISPPPGDFRGYEAREAWAAENGGVRANLMEVQVTVTGNSNLPVLLTNLTADVIERRPPLAGTHLVYGPIGEPIQERFIAVDLDQQPPAISPSVDERSSLDSNLEPDPVDFPYQVQRGEVEVFYLYVTTTNCDCDWTAELAYSVDGEREVLSVQDGDQPFRLTASSAAETYASNDEASFESVMSTDPDVAVELRPNDPSAPSSQPDASSTAARACVDDPAGDTAPRTDDSTDVVQLCGDYRSSIRVTAATRGHETPLRATYDQFTVMMYTDDDEIEDYYAAVQADGSVTVVDLAGEQQEVCKGRGGWQGGELWIEFDAECVGAPSSVRISADVIRVDGEDTLYDNVPDYPPPGRFRELLTVMRA